MLEFVFAASVIEEVSHPILEVMASLARRSDIERLFSLPLVDDINTGIFKHASHRTPVVIDRFPKNLERDTFCFSNPLLDEFNDFIEFFCHSSFLNYLISIHGGR